MDSDEDDIEDLARRQREISAFSVMAAGGTMSLIPNEEPVYQMQTSTESSAPLLEDDPAQTRGSRDTAALFTEVTANVDDSGTFAIKSQSNPVSVAVSSNLEAALAALTGEEPSTPVAAAFAPPNLSRTAAKYSQPAIAMHSEQVLLPRPFFFGPLLPPRVLQETRKLVANAMKERGIEGSAEDPPRLSLLPPQIRNLIGAIDAFGHGLSPFPSKNELNESEPAYFTGNSYVSTYQPVWGASTRIQRGNVRKMRRARSGFPINKSTMNKEGAQAHIGFTELEPMTRGSNSTRTSGSSITERNSGNISLSQHSEASKDAESLVGQLENESLAGETVAVNKSDTDLMMTHDDRNRCWSKEGSSKETLLSTNAQNNSQIQEESRQLLTSENKQITTLTNQSLGSKLTTGVVSSSTLYSQDQFSKWARHDYVQDQQGEPSVPNAMSEQERFSQWARGESVDATTLGPTSGTIGTKEANPRRLSVNSDTFRNVVPINDDSDDESVVGSEMKKKVGINEHLDAAVASFAEHGVLPIGESTNAGESMSADDSQALLSQLALTTNGGRPLTNLELTNGCIPLYGCDDPSLPNESDLGIYETKEDQIRNIEAKRSQEIVEKYSTPNVFGPISCPSPSSGPDDNHSWNSRSIIATNSGSSQATGSVGLWPVPESGIVRKNGLLSPGRKSNQSHNDLNAVLPPAIHTASSVSPSVFSSSQSPKGKPLCQRKGQKTPACAKSLANNDRYGWWSISDNDDHDEGEDYKCTSKECVNDSALQHPPLEHIADSLIINNRLTPLPSTLKEENLPLSHMHAASSIANTLPFLSDRPPSWRYVQVDAKAVGFRPIGGEIEPLFCSLAIYHIETQRPNAASATDAPTPNIQRCGRVTEVLNFDVVTDHDIETRCQATLWPYLESEEASASECTQGTRCGVFPIPANLQLANLYAVIIVRKVFSDDSDIDAYMLPSDDIDSKGTSQRPLDLDLSSYRSKAEKASQRQGKFLTPFAFGVAPILQVFGTDVPTVPLSRAVGIPLFSLSPGLGDRPIIDHIMVMLFPRADHKSAGISGPALSTNGGQALLVMRYYGFLGLHNVVRSNSKIARQRLVDFSGELQLSERDHTLDLAHYREHLDCSCRDFVVPAWCENFISEPTINGGRNIVEVRRLLPPGADVPPKKTANSLADNEYAKSPTFYAQELSPIPLSLNPLSGNPLHSPVSMLRKTGLCKDAEPTFMTSFCNQLYCTPRLIHNCPKGNVVLKVELRELEWKDHLDGFLAELPQGGPSLHNPRRGPALVSHAFTSCVPSTSFAYFIEEFKLRLPLTLQRYDTTSAGNTRKLVILFSVYRFATREKKSWTKKITQRLGVSKPQDISEQPTIIGEDCDGRKSRLILVSSGYAPVTLNSDICSLIASGLFDVKMAYNASLAPEGVSESNDALILRRIVPLERISPKSDLPGSVGASSANPHDEVQSISGENPNVDRDDVLDDSLLGSEPALSEALTIPNDHETTISAVSEATFNIPTRGTSIKPTEIMILQVRIIVQSSLHPQNATLREFMQRIPDRPSALDTSNLSPSSVWRLNRVDLIETQEREISAVNTYQADEETGRLIVSTIDISKPSLCPPSVISTHWIRTVSQLLKIMIAGNGDAALLWANPAAVIPLRIHAFATFLQVFSSGSAYLMKNGATQMDGRNKWNATTFSRLVAMIFDESSLFDIKRNHTEEPFDAEEWTSSPAVTPVIPCPDKCTSAPTSSKSHRKRHTRTNSDNFFTISNAVSSTDMLASERSATRKNSGGRSVITPLSDLSKIFSTTNEKEIKNIGDLGTSSDFAGQVQRERSKQLTSIDKLDSKIDFHHALMAGSTDFAIPKNAPTFIAGNGVGNESSGNRNNNSNCNSRRKFMTMPLAALATIREDFDSDETRESDRLAMPPRHTSNIMSAIDDSVDTEMVINATKCSIKQMRVPRVSKSVAIPKCIDSGTDVGDARTVLINDEDIESAGGAFLDVLGQSLGYAESSKSEKILVDEKQQVGHTNHRKTRSRCSVDWTIPDADSITDGSQTDISLSSVSSTTPTNEGTRATPHNDLRKGAGDSSSPELDLTMSTLRDEELNSKSLQNYIDRILNTCRARSSFRWYPFAYEVVIFQWVAVLMEQRRSGEKMSQIRENAPPRHDYPQGSDPEGASALKDAANRARGITVACAPVLFEIVKKSLGWRLHNLIRRADAVDASPSQNHCPRLIRLDDSIMSSLDYLISSLTDACIDTRNFDSWEFRQTSIDVNDSIIWFIRDLFGFLEPRSVHRLILVYFSRFGVKEGKRWQDRDSKIGLRCSWEVCKLRLNAVTAFIRLQDFSRVNSPQMMNWGTWPLHASSHETRIFFNDALKTFLSLGMSSFTDADGPTDKSVAFPIMKPHWLAEIVVDICLSGTEHAEQFIQHRAASLLHELFWSQSQEGRANGTSAIIASMHMTFLLKVLSHISYLASLGAKSQLRQDIMPCVVFVAQSAPVGLLRAFWRKLCKSAEGKGINEKYGPIFTTTPYNETKSKERQQVSTSFDDHHHEPNILDMFSLLNLALISLEYEGCENQVETENGADDSDQISIWKKEFLPAVEAELQQNQRSTRINSREHVVEEDAKDAKRAFTSSTSRKWHSHDGAIVIINTCRYIVREMILMKNTTINNISAGQSATKNNNLKDSFIDSNLHFDGFLDLYKNRATDELCFSEADTIVFVRAASSVYIHCLSLRQSDIVRVKAFIASVELVKIYGVKDFMQAVGETLQHWMRVVILHCGARRAQVRVQALEFLALILRLTWNSYGSFSRVRLPLLAIQAEVMERIVATAATRFYREQRRMGMHMQSLSNDSAEASLSLLWRTLDRLHHQSASQNIAFRSDVIRLAEKTKKLYRAYIAAHALAILNRSRSPLSPSNSMSNDDDEREEVKTMLQSRRVSIHRIIMASAGYCKQFLGPQKAASLGATVAHSEAVEDAFLAAADVFSPTELPSHRVAWLQKLAEFHASRSKHAEEATCRFQIHCTYRQAARMHESIWSSVPFLPWANDSSDGVHLDGEGPAGDPDDYYDAGYDYEKDQVFDDAGFYEMNLGKQLDKSNSFRRIFYRVANSVRMRTGDWEIGGNKNLFYGVTCASEYGTVTPWISLREMEEYMVEEAEVAGDLYLKAGIAESSRYTWGLATQFYSIKFNYAKLGHAYRRLSTVVQSRVPVVDTNEQALELSHPLGRFYRVWFHGGAPDELIGAEFVYRASGSVKLEEFGTLLSEAIKCILPESTPIDLHLDDGRPEESNCGWRPNRRLGPTPIEPVKIKVTPLRPLVRRANTIRGTPEWFHRYTDMTFHSSAPEGVKGSKRAMLAFDKERKTRNGTTHRQRDHLQSYSGAVPSSSGSIPSWVSDLGSASLKPTDPYRESGERTVTGGGDLMGVDRFTFFQPVNKARGRSSRDWLKSTGDFADKSLRVTLLQVERTFPACVARQSVTNRTVFTQSPLEAGVYAVCSWCSVLFRTAVATNGQAVLGKKFDGIGKQASKVVSDCIHSSRVKDMGLILLKQHGTVAEESDTDFGTMTYQYGRLSEEEILCLQVKLARGIVVFLEILHLLIAHNRDLLLAVVEARKRNDSESLNTFGNNSQQRDPTMHRGISGYDPTLTGSPERSDRSQHLRNISSWSLPPSHNRDYSGASIPTDVHEPVIQDNTSNLVIASAVSNDRTDSAIAIQSELQRSFMSMTKALYPHVSRVLHNETPRWLKQCSQESYFSSHTYRQTRIPMAEELCFFAQDELSPHGGSAAPDETTDYAFSTVPSVVSSAEKGFTSALHFSESPGGSQAESSIQSHPRGPGWQETANSSDGSYRQIV